MEDNELKEKKLNEAEASQDDSNEPKLERSQIEKKDVSGDNNNVIPMAKYLKEKSKRQELEKKLKELNEQNYDNDFEDDAVTDERKILQYLLQKEKEREEAEQIRLHEEKEKQYASQQQQLFEKDFAEFTKYYPNANTSEIKEYLRYLGDKNPTTPLNVLYKQSPFFKVKDSAVESGVKKVEAGSETLTVDPKAKGDMNINDYKKINYASDEEFQKYLEEKYGAR